MCCYTVSHFQGNSIKLKNNCNVPVFAPETVSVFRVKAQ